MMTVEFSTALLSEVDEPRRAIPPPPEAHLWPREVVTWGLLHALKGGGTRPFYRCLTRDYRAVFPHLPERPRLCRLFTTHHDWTQAFLAAPTVLGGIDTSGIALLHPRRAGRSPQQRGRPGLSYHRWLVGGTRCRLLTQDGRGGRDPRRDRPDGDVVRRRCDDRSGRGQRRDRVPRTRRLHRDDPD